MICSIKGWNSGESNLSACAHTRERERDREATRLVVVVVNNTECKNARACGGATYLIHDHDVTLAEVGDALICKIENTTGRGDHNMHGIVQTHNVVLEARTTGTHHHLDVHMFSELLADLRGLQSQFAGGNQDQHCSTRHTKVSRSSQVKSSRVKSNGIGRANESTP